MIDSRDRTARSDYMHWAKFQQPVRYALSSSEVPHVRLDDLPFSLADLELDGASHPRYAPLVDAIAAHCGVPSDQVVPADGTSMANFLALASLINPGDDILFERPGYEPLLAAARFLGARVRFLDRLAEEEYQIDPEVVGSLHRNDTRLIVLTNLHNPTGALLEADKLRTIGALARDSGAKVLVDEVYLESAGSPQPTAAGLGPEFVVTSSLTKVYGLSGLRCGWILAEPELAERIWRLNDLMVVNRAHQAERLACIAFEHLADISAGLHQRLRENRALLNTFLAGRTDLEGMEARHGMTAFPRWSGGDTRRLDEYLRTKFDTSVVPGHWFDLPDHFRIGFGGDTSDLKEGLSRLGEAMDRIS
jgi:aspartate/methionine/tyrosine aminotransferase